MKNNSKKGLTKSPQQFQKNAKTLMKNAKKLTPNQMVAIKGGSQGVSTFDLVL